MRTLALVLGLASAVAAADAPKADTPPAKEQDKMHGIWRIETEAVEGTLPVKTEKKIRLVFLQGDEFIYLSGSAFLAGTYRIDTTVKPIKLDLVVNTSSVPSFKDKVLLAVCEVRNDELKFCRGGPGKDRPADFTTKPGSGHISQVLRREKP